MKSESIKDIAPTCESIKDLRLWCESKNLRVTCNSTEEFALSLESTKRTIQRHCIGVILADEVLIELVKANMSTKSTKHSALITISKELWNRCFTNFVLVHSCTVDLVSTYGSILIPFP